MATAINNSSTIVNPTSVRPTYSCTRCVDRKVKCDRQKPCSACVKHNVDCVYNTSQPPRKRQRRAKEQILEDRLRYYEALLQREGVDPTKLPLTPEVEAEPISKSANGAILKDKGVSMNLQSSQDIRRTQITHGQGQTQFIHNSLYTRVVEELQEPEDDLDDILNEESDLEASGDDFGFVLGSRSRFKTKSRHLRPERIHELWQIFKENVDPLTKIVHVPSLQPAIEKAVNNIEAIPRNFEALLFAICGAAIMSLNDEDCRQRFHESRRALLSQNITHTKGALSRANFMATTSLVVLQALVLYLLTVRDMIEPRAVWSLTGVAVRIAESMGLDRDGTFLGLPVFESEMRRRIWWLLKTHDFRTAELCGLPKFRDLNTGYESTKWPTNVNDDQLYPGISSLVAVSNGLTDVAFLALRYEIANFAASRVTEFRQQGMGPDQWDLHASASKKEKLDEVFKGLEQLLETKYLRYCDPSQPLHLMTMLIARFSLNIIRFLGHHPRRWASIEQTPLSERQWVWEISIKLLEQHSMVQSNPQLKRFAWHAEYFQQWHAFLHVLDVLRSDPLVINAEKAWQLVGNIYANTPDMIFDMRKPIHVAVGNLCLKAYGSREAAVQSGKIQTPEFILQLRQQREVVKARRQARDAKRSLRKELVDPVQTKSDPTILCLSETLESTNIQPTTIPSLTNLNQTEYGSDGDQFWLINGFDDGQSGDLDIAMDMDLDFMLAQDQIMEDDASKDISWDQWDTWLAESNLLRPMSSVWDISTGS